METKDRRYIPHPINWGLVYCSYSQSCICPRQLFQGHYYPHNFLSNNNETIITYWISVTQFQRLLGFWRVDSLQFVWWPGAVMPWASRVCIIKDNEIAYLIPPTHLRRTYFLLFAWDLHNVFGFAPRAVNSNFSWPGVSEAEPMCPLCYPWHISNLKSYVLS